jgi:putative ABC transport system substrate-binding protein
LDPRFLAYEDQFRDVREAARTLDLQVHELRASTDAEIDLAYETVARQHIPAVTVAAGPFFDTRRDRLVALAARHAVPTMYHFREFPAAGGLISYGTSIPDAYRQAAIYVGRILKGAKPADLPVVQPTKFELVLNLNTAKVLGIAIPPKLLALADEVIE